MNSLTIMRLYLGLFDKFRKRAIKHYNRNQCKRRINGTSKLTKEQKQKILRFYEPYGKVTTMFHEMYYEKTGFFTEQYIPSDIYVNAIDEYFNPRQEGKYLDNKCYYSAIFAGLKQPSLAIARIGGFWYNADRQLINADAVEEILKNEQALFVKAATESYGGQGVSYISAKDGDICAQFKKVADKIKGDLIAQRPIIQHKELAAINESSVNTIRMISLLTENGPKIYSGILRVGVNGKKVDNYTSGGMTVGIKEDGTLKKYAYNAKGERFDKHPSGFVFEGYKVPCLEKARDMVMKAHPMVPHFRLVSFDIAIDENGEPVFVEANLCKGSLEIHEYSNAPVFGEDTKKILDEVFGVK